MEKQTQQTLKPQTLTVREWDRVALALHLAARNPAFTAAQASEFESLRAKIETTRNPESLYADMVRAGAGIPW